MAVRGRVKKDDGVIAPVREYYVAECNFDNSKTYCYKVARWLDGKTMKNHIAAGERIHGVVTVGGDKNLNTTIVCVTNVREVSLVEFKRLPSVLVQTFSLGQFHDYVDNAKKLMLLQESMDEELRRIDHETKLVKMAEDIPEMKSYVEQYRELVKNATY